MLTENILNNCNYSNKIDHKIIKEWLFYDKDNNLCSIEQHTFNNTFNNTCTKSCNNICTQYYFNNQKIYDTNVILEYYADIIINTQYIIKEHNDFIDKIVSYIGPLTFENKLSYGWYNKNIKYSLTIYKYKKIECIINFNNETTIVNKENTIEFVEKYLTNVILQSQLYNQLHNLNLNESTMNDLNESVNNDSQSQLINTMNNLNLNESTMNDLNESTMNNLNESINNIFITDNIHDNYVNDYSHLFIKFPKNKRIEFQSCKPYDPDEITFKQLNNDYIDKDSVMETCIYDDSDNEIDEDSNNELDDDSDNEMDDDSDENSNMDLIEFN